MRLTLAPNVVPIAFYCAKRCRSEVLRTYTAFAYLPLSACQAAAPERPLGSCRENSPPPCLDIIGERLSEFAYGEERGHDSMHQSASSCERTNSARTCVSVVCSKFS